jgi:hypothetical protein
MTAFNRIDSDPRNLNAGSIFQLQDSQGRLVELNMREATEVTGWLVSFLYPEAILRPPTEKQSEDEAMYTGLLTALVVQAIQQAYIDGKIADVDTFNHLYEEAKKANAQTWKLADVFVRERKTTITKETKEAIRLAVLARRLWHLTKRDFDADALDIQHQHKETLEALQARATPALAALLALLSTCLDVYEDNPREWEV